jgi:hypothetical protein
MKHEQRIERKRQQVEEAARALGELMARETFDEGVGLDVDLFTIESLAVIAAKAVVRGVVETATADQAQSLGAEHACPGCGRRCRLERRSRVIQVRGGTANVAEPVGHCPACRRDFFPSAAGAQA